ncbi:hypothetical protein F5Y11DRAFT_360963 [Daldinia sp. FL1419]|nr:hypothetical protein F5Y11DRAFT_360963 [Daldinia sp. FL1419]
MHLSAFKTGKLAFASMASVRITLLCSPSIPPLTGSVSLLQLSRPASPTSSTQNDTLVIFQVETADILEKLPIQFKTVLNCVPNYVIYSDVEETINEQHIYNFLDQINETLRDTISEIELYNRLYANAREELEHQTSRLDSTPHSLGRKLRKWKLLPIAEKALRYMSDARWFVFLEVDTYMIWGNVQEYLTQIDAEQPQYLMGNMLSNPAMKEVVEYWASYQKEWHQDPNAREAERIMGMTLGDALRGVESNPSPSRVFPYLRVNELNNFDWTTLEPEESTQCYAPITKFEQEGLHQNPNRGRLTLRDIFKRLIYHQIETKKRNWDNLSVGVEYSNKSLQRPPKKEKDLLSPVEQQAQLSFEKCRDACESEPACIQFSYARGSCVTSTSLRLGHTTDTRCESSSRIGESCNEQGSSKINGGTYPEEIQSGWIVKRVSSYSQKLDLACDGRESTLDHETEDGI